MMPRRPTTADLRPGDRVRVVEFPPGGGWHPARSRRGSLPAEVVAVRDTGPGRTARYRVAVRLDDGRLVSFGCRPDETHWREEVT